MRLTLRTLLAYLDDTLPPDQAREIGQKVAESHVAQELIERIKKVTRRRGLTVPPTAGPDRIDANTIAEYLDNDLSGDKVAEVEELALNSDVVLAEVAASHQILTLVIGEPAHVPPTARQRMYQLVKGRESVHTKRAARVVPSGLPDEVVTAGEMRARRRRLGYLLVGTALLGAAAGVAIWKALPAWPQRTNQQTADNTTPPTPVNNPDATQPTPNPAGPDAGTPPKPADSNPTTPPAAPTEVPTPVVPMGPKQPIDVPPDRSPSAERREAGKLVARDVVLLAREGDGWTRVAPDSTVRTTTTLLSLSGYHSDVRLESGARLTLWGSLPDLLNWPVLESAVTLHAPPAGFDLDFTLLRGRVYVAAKPNGPTKVRARFAGEVWDLNLADEKTEVLLDVLTLYAGELFRKEGKGESPLTQATLGVVAGKAEVAVDAQTFQLQAPPGPAGLLWDNKRGGVSQKPLEFNALPPYWGKAPQQLPRARQLDIEAALKKLQQRAADKDKAIDVAIAEVGQDTSRSAQALAIYCQGALGNLTTLLDALEDGLADVRQAAVLALQHFVARQPGNDVLAFEQLKARKGYTEAQAERAVRLLHGFTETELSDPTTYEQLIGDLRNEKIGLRELTVWRLSQADREGARTITFNATDPEPQREQAIAAWRKRIPPGSVPPRSGPQGQLPALNPTRGY